MLEQFVSTSPTGPHAQRAWASLARARDAAGDRAGALDAYTRALKDANPSDLRPEMAIGYARLLAQDKRWQDARKLLEPLLRSDDKAVVASAAAGLGEAYQGEGENLAAAEYFMTAAYVAPDTPAGRGGLLGRRRLFRRAQAERLGGDRLQEAHRAEGCSRRRDREGAQGTERHRAVKGYGGRLLFVDLTAGTTRIEALDEATARALLGGNGLAARLLYDHVPAGIDAFDAENAVVFGVGPITDTTVPGNSRACVADQIAADRPLLRFDLRRALPRDAQADGLRRRR